MADVHDNGFGKFIPGFDFLQNLAKGASQTVPQMPGLGSWLAPTLNEEELDKRISELKAVHFWLDQNSRALGATVQALEVQKLTLATLKGMSVNISEMANAFKPKAAETPAAEVQKTPDKPTVAAQPAATETTEQTQETAATAAAAPKSMVDPLQMWTSLTQQFQQIAASAMKDAGNATAAAQPQPQSKRVPAKTGKAPSGEAAPPAKKRAAAKKAVKKSAPPAAAQRAARRRT
jgi:hypothetical protein